MARRSARHSVTVDARSSPPLREFRSSHVALKGPVVTRLQSIPIETMDSEVVTLGRFAGEVLLLVNVASKCGLTPQYEALEWLHRRCVDRGLRVLAFPANDFRGQEPGSNEEILEFCRASYDVTFPVFAKITVTGPDKHPLYAELIDAQGRASGDPDAHRQRLRGYGITPTEEPEILWNFEKFLVGRDGRVAARFAPSVEPDAPELIAALEAELAKPRTEGAVSPAVERIEVARAIAAPPDAIFALLRDPAGHVAIDASGMLMSATGSPASGVGDSFVVHMDRDSLRDHPLGEYDVTVTFVVYEPNREIAWGVGMKPGEHFGHVYGYRLEPIEGGNTVVTQYYDWSGISEKMKQRGVFPVISESALRATLGILARTVAPGAHRPDTATI